MKSQPAYLFFLLFQILSACSQPDPASQIDVLMIKLFEEGEFNGAVMISENNELVYGKGFGYADFEKQIPFKTSTTMDAASITKTFTAFSILLLEQEEKLSFNDLVVNHLRSFPYENIKIKHLLHQTSGLVSDDFVFDQAPEGETLFNSFFLEALVDNVPQLSFEPGSQFQYNDINHILLAMIVERISGYSFDEFIRSRVTNRLDMNDWFLRPARLMDWTKDRTRGYAAVKDSITNSDVEDFEGFYGNCNLFFSAVDLLKWSQSFYSNTLIEKAELNELLKAKDSLSSFNPLHWYSLKDNNQFHFTGDWKGFYTMVYFDTNRERSIVYLSNTSIDYGLRPQLVDAFVKILNGEPAKLIKPNPIKVSSDYLNASYEVANFGIIELSTIGDNSKITIDSKSYDLFVLDKNYYYVPALDLWMWFTYSSDQRINLNCSNIYGKYSGQSK